MAFSVGGGGALGAALTFPPHAVMPYLVVFGLGLLAMALKVNSLRGCVVTAIGLTLVAHNLYAAESYFVDSGVPGIYLHGWPVPFAWVNWIQLSLPHAFSLLALLIDVTFAAAVVSAVCFFTRRWVGGSSLPRPHAYLIMFTGTGITSILVGFTRDEPFPFNLLGGALLVAIAVGVAYGVSTSLRPQLQFAEQIEE